MKIKQIIKEADAAYKEIKEHYKKHKKATSIGTKKAGSIQKAIEKVEVYNAVLTAFDLKSTLKSKRFKKLQSKMSRATQRISHLEAILNNSRVKKGSKVSSLVYESNNGSQASENNPSAGIINPNNLCFLNTVMQLMTHCSPLAESILKTASNEDSEFFQAMASACEVIRSSEETLPAEFIIDVYETVQKSIQLQGQPIQNFQQEDACDLLLAIFTHDLV